MIENKQITAFLDSIGRTIIGEPIETVDGILKIKDPVVVNIVPNAQTGQISLQLLPLFFREFLADPSESTVWGWHINSITQCEGLHLDFKVLAQYQQIFNTQKRDAAPPAESQQNIVKLFEE